MKFAKVIISSETIFIDKFYQALQLFNFFI